MSLYPLNEPGYHDRDPSPAAEARVRELTDELIADALEDGELDYRVLADVRRMAAKVMGMRDADNAAYLLAERIVAVIENAVDMDRLIERAWRRYETEREEAAAEEKRIDRSIP